MKTYRELSAHDSLVPHDSYFNAAAIPGDHDQRSQPFAQEICELNFLSRFMKDVMMRKQNLFQVMANEVVLALRD